jgi:hypothetical protein
VAENMRKRKRPAIRGSAGNSEPLGGRPDDTGRLDAFANPHPASAVPIALVGGKGFCVPPAFQHGERYRLSWLTPAAPFRMVAQ